MRLGRASFGDSGAVAASRIRTTAGPLAEQSGMTDLIKARTLE